MACAGLLGSLAVTQGCRPAALITGKISGDELIVPLSAFETKNGPGVYYKRFIVIENDMLKYPICIYRIDKHEYNALWMRCTHQGTELQVFGSYLQCPAHGSEFLSDGSVQTGPAAISLRKFPCTVFEKELHISLKAI